MATKPWHNAERLRELYIDERLDLQEIADRWGCSKDTVWRWKNKHGIKQPWKCEGTLKELYVDKQLSMADIADELGCNKQTVKNWLDKHGIETRDASFRRNPGSFGIYLNNWGHVHINHSYKGEQWSVFAHRLLALVEHDIESLKGKEVHHKNGIPWDNRPENLEVVTKAEHSAKHHDNNPDTPWRDENKLINTYENQGSCKKAAEKLGCTAMTVHNWLQRFGYDISTSSK